MSTTMAFRFEEYDRGDRMPDDGALEVAVASVTSNAFGSASIAAVVPPVGARSIRALALAACVKLMESLPPSDPTVMPRMPGTLAVRMIRVDDTLESSPRSVADVVFEPERTLCGYNPELDAPHVAGLRLMLARVADELEANR